MRGLPHLIIGENGNDRRFKPSSVEKWLEAQSKAEKSTPQRSDSRNKIIPKDDVTSKTESLKKIRKDKKAHIKTWSRKGGICDVV